MDDVGGALAYGYGVLKSVTPDDGHSQSRQSLERAEVVGMPVLGLSSIINLAPARWAKRRTT